MAENKKGFMLYADQKALFEKLPNEKAGELIKHIFSYVNDENPSTEDLLIDIAFESIKQQLKRDLKKWEQRAENSRINGSLGGRPKNPKEPKKPNGLIINPEEPRKPVTVNDNVNVNDILNKELIDVKFKKKEVEENSEPKKQEEVISLEEQFELFFEKYHKLSGMKKTDKKAALGYWKKLTLTDRRMAYKNIDCYIASLTDKKFCKKARTYLADRNFEDEFDADSKYKFLSPEEIQRKSLMKDKRYILINNEPRVFLSEEDKIKLGLDTSKDYYLDKGKPKLL